jgi:hypothetical protein
MNGFGYIILINPTKVIQMTKERELIEFFETMLAKLSFNGKLEQARLIAPVVEALEDAEYDEAVRLAIKAKLPIVLVTDLITVFGVENVKFCPESYQQELSKSPQIFSSESSVRSDNGF